MKILDGRTAVVTGTGSGIGRALAYELARSGCRLALSDINEETLAETAHQAEALGAEVQQRVLDVADRAGFESYAQEVVDHFGSVHLVINNAGVALNARIDEMTVEELEWQMSINFWGVVYGTLFFLPHLKQAEEGHVVNISSVFGIVGFPGVGAYNASKFAVRGFTECLRQEMDLDGASVGVTSVHPGGIKTNIARDSRIGIRREATEDRATRHDKFTEAARTTPESAAQQIVAAVLANKKRLLIGSDARLLDRIQRLLPTAHQSFIRRMYAEGVDD